MRTGRRAAIERIPSTASRLIEQGGIERLNTKLVAAESGNNIPAASKYLPNPLAIPAMPFQRQGDERDAVFSRAERTVCADHPPFQ